MWLQSSHVAETFSLRNSESQLSWSRSYFLIWDNSAAAEEIPETKDVRHLTACLRSELHVLQLLHHSWASNWIWNRLNTQICLCQWTVNKEREVPVFGPTSAYMPGIPHLTLFLLHLLTLCWSKTPHFHLWSPCWLLTHISSFSLMSCFFPSLSSPQLEVLSLPHTSWSVIWNPFISAVHHLLFWSLLLHTHNIDCT